MYDYARDRFGKACIGEAKLSKSNIGFGAVLVKNNRIIGRGRNTLPTKQERTVLNYIDYAIHAEQQCVVDALLKGKNISGAEIYVVGVIMRGPKKGTIAFQSSFVCRNCPPSVLLRFKLSVHIPTSHGWKKVSPATAAKSSKKFHGTGHWKRIASEG